MFCFLNTGILFPNLLTDLFMLKFKHKQNLFSGFKPFPSQDLNSDSPYCLTHNFYDFSSENLVLDQLLISH